MVNALGVEFRIVVERLEHGRSRARKREETAESGLIVADDDFDGVAVRGPMLGKQHAYVLVSDWLGSERKPVDREAALAELARRYLVGHAPADDRDLARWAGLPLRDARAGLVAIAKQLVERDDGRVELKDSPKPAPIPTGSA